MWLKLVFLAVLLGCFRANVVRLGAKKYLQPTGTSAPGPERVIATPQPQIQSEESEAPAQPPAKTFRPGKVVNTEQEIRQRMFEEVAGEDDIGTELRMIKKLGQGAYGKVFQAFDNRLQRVVACKSFSKPARPALTRKMKQLMDMSAKTTAFQEIFILLHIPSHKNLCQFLRYLEDDQQVVVVLEYCGGRTLREFSTEFTPEPQIKQFFGQTVEGLQALHDHGVLHLDLKLANIMVNDEGVVKIIDYSTSVFNQTLLSFGFGPGGYEAPECFLSGLKNGKMLDIWALGVGLFRLLYGYKPFGDYGTREETARLLRYEYEFGGRRVSAEVKDLIRHIFVPADQRYTLAQIQQHAWLANKRI